MCRYLFKVALSHCPLQYWELHALALAIRFDKPLAGARAYIRPPWNLFCFLLLQQTHVSHNLQCDCIGKILGVGWLLWIVHSFSTSWARRNEGLLSLENQVTVIVPFSCIGNIHVIARSCLWLQLSFFVFTWRFKFTFFAWIIYSSISRIEWKGAKNLCWSWTCKVRLEWAWAVNEQLIVVW